MSNEKGFFSPETHKDWRKTGLFYNIADYLANYYGADGKYWGRNDPNWKPNKRKTAGPKGYGRPTAKQKFVKGK